MITDAYLAKKWPARFHGGAGEYCCNTWAVSLVRILPQMRLRA